MTTRLEFNPKLDLVLDRVVEVPRELVWAAWTQPEHLQPWFCPRPWAVSHCEIDLRPGGAFHTVMAGPAGESISHTGCYLEIVPHSRLSWTNVLLPGYRPAPVTDFPTFTAIITLEPAGNGTRYIATVLHGDSVSRDKHNALGFAEGWGQALDQMVEYAKTMK